MHTLARFSLNHLLGKEVVVYHKHGYTIGTLHSKWINHFHIEDADPNVCFFNHHDVERIVGHEIALHGWIKCTEF